MASIYSKRLASGDQATGVLATVYTCPADTVAVVRSIRFVPKSSGSGNEVYLVLAGNFVVAYFGITQWVTQADEGRHVLNAGETLQVGTGSGEWYFTISGYELST